jgi:hypothetical protein
VTIHTTLSLRAARYRLERRMEKATAVLDEMRRGAALHLTYMPGGTRWVLTTGTWVPDKVARLVIQSSSVIAAGDTLLDGTPSQGWRYWRV